MFEMIRNEEYGKNSEFIVEESMQNVCEMNRKLDLFDKYFIVEVQKFNK